MNINFNYFYYVLILTVIVLVSCNSELNLDDTWEGENIYIDAELKVADYSEVVISRTFNPILDSNPDNKYITDADIIIYQDEIPYDTFIYFEDPSPIDSKPIFVSTKEITPSHCYRLKIEYLDKTINSKEVCIPDAKIVIGANKMIVDDDYTHFSFEGFVEATNIDAESISVGASFSPNLWRKYDHNSEIETTVNCFYDNVLDMDCMDGERFEFSYSNSFRDYTHTELDYFFVGTKFISRDLEVLRSDNKYKRGEFEVNASYNSSFDNDTYGVFGYSYRKAMRFPF